MNTYEQYIWKQLRRIEDQLNTLNTERYTHYTEKDYYGKFHRLSGQKDILYMLLTGHDNKYEQEQK